MNLFKRSSRRRSSSAPAFAPACVALEDRQLLSGNVTVAYDGADLEITGDNAANEVQVFHDGANVVVRGLNGTKINGVAGDFVAAFATNTLGGGLTVNLGKGNDLFYMSDGVGVTNDLSVEPSAGNDKTVLIDLTVAGDIAVGAPLGLLDDPGNDNVWLENTVGSTIMVATGNGSDIVNLSMVNATQDLIVLLGAGNDGVGGSFAAVDTVYVGAGAGNDFLFGSFSAGGFGIDMEAGNDALLLVEVNQTDPLRTASINLGTGNDKATVGLSSASFASFLSVTGSTGNDKFFLVPGATLSGGSLISEVESTAPYIVIADPAIEKAFKATFKRSVDFADYVATLP